MFVRDDLKAFITMLNVPIDKVLGTVSMKITAGGNGFLRQRLVALERIISPNSRKKMFGRPETVNISGRMG